MNCCGSWARAATALHPAGTQVVLLVGVNGVGKTTTLGKLAAHLKGPGGGCAGGGRGHLPCRGHRPAGIVGPAGRGPGHPEPDGRRPGGHRLRRGHQRQGQWHSLGPHRHGGTAAHQGPPHEGAGQDPAQPPEGDPRGTPSGVVGAGRHHRAERSGAGRGFCPGGRCHGPGPHQAGWQRQGGRGGIHPGSPETPHRLRGRGRELDDLVPFDRRGLRGRAAGCLGRARPPTWPGNWPAGGPCPDPAHLVGRCELHGPGPARRDAGGRACPAPTRPWAACWSGTGRVVGSGVHTRAGDPHGEIMALRDAESRDEDPRGATAYVTLEPCCYHGRTPPCTSALGRHPPGGGGGPKNT